MEGVLRVLNFHSDRLLVDCFFNLLNFVSFLKKVHKLSKGSMDIQQYMDFS